MVVLTAKEAAPLAAVGDILHATADTLARLPSNLGATEALGSATTAVLTDIAHDGGASTDASRP